LTNYGKIDIMWFDFSYGEMTGEKWEATKLVELIKSLQPEIIIDNRLGGDVFAEEPVTYSGDFASPEQNIPGNGLLDKLGRAVPWESCITLNDNWGHQATDKNYKTPKNVVRMLVENVSKGGNLLINVGPNAKGEIPKESISILKAVGEWMWENGESIYGCGKSQLEKPEWGRFTQKGQMLYAHVLDRGIGPIRIVGHEGKIKKARLLSDGSELEIFRPWFVVDGLNDAYVNIESATLPDEIDTVIELELNNI
ncbi:MAG: alpha-L-fucosidase, partial [Bacteroidota bacterium]